MTEHTEAQLVEKEPVQKMHEFAKQCYSIYWRRWCAGGVHFPTWDDLDWHTSLHIKEAIKTAAPLIQQQVLRGMYESTKTDYLISPSPRPADFVKKHAKETYGIDL